MFVSVITLEYTVLFYIVVVKVLAGGQLPWATRGGVHPQSLYCIECLIFLVSVSRVGNSPRGRAPGRRPPLAVIIMH